MLYMATEIEGGLRVFLGLCKENIGQIKADNPLVARLSNIDYNGLFFLCLSDMVVRPRG